MDLELSQFEQELLHLEQLVRESDAPVAVFQASVKALRRVAEIAGCSVWITAKSGTRRLIQEGKCVQDQLPLLQMLQSCIERGETETSLLAEESTEVSHGADTSAAKPQKVLLAGTALVPDENLTLEVRLANNQHSSPLMREGMTAVVECLADFYRRILLADARRQLSISTTLSGITHLLYRQSNASDRAAVLVNEVRAAVGVDRVSLLVRSSRSQWNLLQASGADEVERGSTARLAIEDAAQELVRSGQVRKWIHVNSNDLTDQPAIRNLALHGAQHIHILPLQANSGDSSAKAPEYALLLECFAAPSLECSDELLQHLSGQVQHLLRHCFGSPETGWKQKLLGRGRILLITLAAMLLLLIWPRDFEVQVRGQAYPQHRVRVFAPADGVVETLSVDNQTVVDAGSELLQIRDEDLELEVQRTLGNLQTEKTRLAALQRSRTLQTQSDRGLPTSEAAAEQRIEGLTEQLKLLNRHRDGLTLKSNIAGTTLRANLRDELLSRPVRRGQILFEIVPSESPWQLELKIPDHLVGYVRDAMQDTESPETRFFSRLSPETAITGKLQSVDNYVLEENQTWYSRGIVLVPDDAVSNLTIGASVTARIHCGRATTAFVVFREVIEFGRELWFTWM